MFNIQRPRGAYAPVGQAFPIGSVFIAVVSTNPATLLGYGTWSAFGAGRVLVGLDSGDTDFDTAEETGGAKTVASAGSVAAPASHANHTHTGPSHQHNLSGGAATAHDHTYTQVPNHVHSITSLRGASTGAATTVASGLTAGSDTSSTAVSHDTLNPTGGVATGTTAVNTAGATDTEGTGATGNESAALSHNAPAFTGSATSVVQPYIVCYFWKRTA